MLKWIQETIRLPEYTRGFHLVTRKIEDAVPELSEVKVGMANIFLLHTSAGLTLNENADPTVRRDFETHFNKMVPEDATHYTHTFEGSDDITAHIKSSLVGQSVTVPVKNGRLLLGTWQGIYLCEHRNHGGRRQVAVTVWGEDDPESMFAET